MTHVEQVGDARTELHRLNKEKNTNAEWVTGLEDEATLEAYFKRLDATKRKMAKKQAKRLARGLGGANGLKAADVDVSSDDDDEIAEGSAEGLFRGGKRGPASGKHTNKPPGAIKGALIDLCSQIGADLTEVKAYIDDGVAIIRGVHTMWLKFPFLFLLAATLIALAQHFVYYQDYQTFNHPPNEVALWPYARFADPVAVLTGPSLPYNLFHLFAAIGTIWLSLQVGAGSQNFAAFCGVGWGVLALVATILDAVLLVRACEGASAASSTLSSSSLPSCDYPFGSHWVLTAIKTIGTTAGVCLAASVFDLVQLQQSQVVVSTPTPKKDAASDVSKKEAAEAKTDSIESAKETDVPASTISDPTAVAKINHAQKKKYRTTTVVTAIPVVLFFVFYLLSFYRGIGEGDSAFVVTAGAANAAAAKDTQTSGSRQGSGDQRAFKGSAKNKENTKDSANKKGGSKQKPSGKGKEDPSAKPHATFRENLAYYASFAQVIAWCLLIPTIYQQKRLMAVYVDDVKEKIE